MLAVRSVRVFVAALTAAAVLCPPASAGARIEDSFAYPFDEVWSSAVRMLRVDLRFPVTDRDKDNGFMLFDYEDRGRKVPGSLEVFRERGGREEGNARVRVSVQIPAMPSYVERMLVDRLARKLKDDWGEPIEPVRGRDPGRDDDADGDDDAGDEVED